jgi:hypothetical protein
MEFRKKYQNIDILVRKNVIENRVDNTMKNIFFYRLFATLQLNMFCWFIYSNVNKKLLPRI